MNTCLSFFLLEEQRQQQCISDIVCQMCFNVATCLFQVAFTHVTHVSFSQVQLHVETIFFFCNQHMTPWPNTVDISSLSCLRSGELPGQIKPKWFCFSVDAGEEEVCRFIREPHTDRYTHHYSMHPPYKAISVTDLCLVLLCHQLCHIAWLLWLLRHVVKTSDRGNKCGPSARHPTIFKLDLLDSFFFWFNTYGTSSSCVNSWICDRSSDFGLQVYKKQLKRYEMLLEYDFHCWYGPIKTCSDLLCFISGHCGCKKDGLILDHKQLVRLPQD